MTASYFIVRCERCQAKLTPHERISRCKCGVTIEIEWPAKHDHKPPEKTISEEYER
jgi:hypothetical protein